MQQRHAAILPRGTARAASEGKVAVIVGIILVVVVGIIVLVLAVVVACEIVAKVRQVDFLPRVVVVAGGFLGVVFVVVWWVSLSRGQRTHRR